MGWEVTVPRSLGAGVERGRGLKSPEVEEGRHKRGCCLEGWRAGLEGVSSSNAPHRAHTSHIHAFLS